MWNLGRIEPNGMKADFHILLFLSVNGLGIIIEFCSCWVRYGLILCISSFVW